MKVAILTASMQVVASLHAGAQDPPPEVVAVELRGRVLDGGTHPEKGLGSVIVELQPKDDPAKIKTCATGVDGTYKFKDVAPGSYVMRFTKKEFVRRPHPLATEVAKRPDVHKVVDVLLYNENIGDEDAKSTARALIARGKVGSLPAEWRRYEMTLISLPAKAKVAARLVEFDDEAQKIPEVRAFADANVELNADVTLQQQLDKVWRAWVRGDERSAEIVKGYFDSGDAHKKQDHKLTRFLMIDSMARALVQDVALDRSKVEERILKDLPAANDQLQKRLSVYKEL